MVKKRAGGEKNDGRQIIPIIILVIGVILIAFFIGGEITGNFFKIFGAKGRGVVSQCSDHIDNDKDGYCDYNYRRAYCKDGSILGDNDCTGKDDNNETTECVVACTNSNDCGTNGYVGTASCGADGNRYQDYQTFSCSNAGTCTSSCSSTLNSQIIENCANGCANGICNPIVTQNETKQLIFIGVDGMQYAHFKQMLDAGKLPNIMRLAANGFIGNATITGHTRTETAPGNAELHTGLADSITGIVDNTCGKVIPAGLTTFERLASKNINMGLVYGKATCYIPDAILKNAKSKISFWHNRTSYPQTTYVSSNCADSRNVSNKAKEFLNLHKNESFYLVVYFGAPDCAGHTYGENSAGYDNSLINVDEALGILLNYIEQSNKSIGVIISADHGWNEGTTGHGTTAADTLTLPLLSNKLSLVNKIPTDGIRKQCNVAPTVLDYFGVDLSNYPDLTSACQSMINW